MTENKKSLPRKLTDEEFNAIKGDIYDFQNRETILIKIGERIGLSGDDLTVLLFSVMGNVSNEDPKLEHVLKKIKLPKVDFEVKYNKKKLKGYIKMLRNQLKEFEDYWIIHIGSRSILKESKNGKYITAFGLSVPYVIYQSIIRILEEKPEYAMKTFLGIYESMGEILEFLGVINRDE